MASNQTPNFPLLAGDQNSFLANGLSYPRTFSFPDGSEAPLFTAGIVASEELKQIAKNTARCIAERYAGKRLLLIQILEGARPFAAMVIEHLELIKAGYGIRYQVATVQVRSYGQGTQASANHKILQPLQDNAGHALSVCTGFESVVLVDDLIDGGHTVAWLVREYLPRYLSTQRTGATPEIRFCAMLDKERVRDSLVEEVLAECLLSSGLKAPDEWLVGYGLDMALPGREGRPVLHLFRQALPGGIYAFNSAIEQRLIGAYQTDPEEVCRQLAIYLSPA